MGIITHDALKDNIYKDIFEPLVAAYNTTEAYSLTQRGNPNHHEVILAVMYLETRTRYWGEAIPLEPDNRNSIVAGAAADGPGAASPVTTRTEALWKQLNQLVMNQPNAWAQWHAGLDYFYKNIGAYLNYFIYRYKNGAYSKFYEELAGVIRHPQGYKSGIQFGREVEGSDGPDKAVTTITVDIALVGDTDTYFIVHSDAANRTIIWFDVDGSGSGGPVILPIAGVSDQYIKVDLDSTQPPADSALSVRNQLAVAVGWAFEAPTTGGVSDVIITTLTTGSKPASSFNLPAHDTWGGTFVDGDSDPGTTNAVDCWQLWCAPAEEVADRFAVIYDTTGASWLFYYDLNVAGTFVTPVGLLPDNTVAIPVSTGDTVEDVAIVTASTIEAQGFATTAITTGPYGKQTTVEITYTIPAPVNYFDTGTLSFGINFTYNPDLLGSDGSILASGITNNQEFVDAWNEYKVSFEETQGKTYPYLINNTVGIGDEPFSRAGSPCKNNCGVDGIEPGDAVYCDDGLLHCCRGCGGAAAAGLYSISAYPVYPLTNYNTPGNIFIASEGRQANMVRLDQIV